MIGCFLTLTTSATHFCIRKSDMSCPEEYTQISDFKDIDAGPNDDVFIKVLVRKDHQFSFSSGSYKSIHFSGGDMGYLIYNNANISDVYLENINYYTEILFKSISLKNATSFNPHSTLKANYIFSDYLSIIDLKINTTNIILAGEVENIKSIIYAKNVFLNIEGNCTLEINKAIDIKTASNKTIHFGEDQIKSIQTNFYNGIVTVLATENEDITLDTCFNNCTVNMKQSGDVKKMSINLNNSIFDTGKWMSDNIEFTTENSSVKTYKQIYLPYLYAKGVFELIDSRPNPLLMVRDFKVGPNLFL